MADWAERLIRKHVKWTKVEGKANASMVETEGFGLLIKLTEERSMVIWGDNGVITSPVFSIENHQDGVRVTTRNSVYIIKT